MTLCINQSGTWRILRKQCVNQSGTWRFVRIGCINQSGTWRRFNPGLGYFLEGGYVISIGTCYRVVAPVNAEVCVRVSNQSNMVASAQSQTGTSGWFVPSCSDLKDAYTCRVYWDTYTPTVYLSSTRSGDSYSGFTYYGVCMANGSGVSINTSSNYLGRAFKNVTL